MLYNKEDFANLRFNPLADGDILDVYPDLNILVLPSKSGELDTGVTDLDKLIRFSIILSDPKSVVVLAEKDLVRRKDLAAELVDLPEDPAFRESVFMYNNAVVFYASIQYLKFFAKSKEFAALITFEQCYWEEISLLNKPIDRTESDKDVLTAVEKKGKIKSELELDLNRIDAAYKRFLGEDEALIAKKERMTPENIRKLKSRG